MKHNAIALLAAAICLFPTLSTSQDGGAVETIIGDEKVEQTFHKNGKPKSDARKRKARDGKWVAHGVVKTWYPSGATRGILSYNMGVPTGTWKTFDENGKQYDERVYKEGKPTGTWKRFYDSGQVMDESTCKSVSATVTEVRMKVYNENGKVREEGRWRREALVGKKPTNVKDGKWLYYDDNGQLEKTEVYSKGKLEPED